MVEGEGDQSGSVKEPGGASSSSLSCPMLSQINYTIWAMRMKAIFNVHGVWEQIEPGTAGDVKKNNIAIALLFQSIPENQILQVGNLKTAKEMWETLKTRNLGAERVREARLQTLMFDFENLKMKEQSTVDEFASLLSGFSSKAASLGTKIDEPKLVKRFLNGLPRKFIHMVASIEQVVDLKTITFDDVVGRLKAYEERIKEEKDPAGSQGQLLFSQGESSSNHKYNNGGRGRNGSGWRGRGRGRGSGQGQYTNQNRDNGKGGGSKGSGQRNNDNRQKPKKDKSKIQCYRCDQFGHYASSCPERKQEQESNLTEETDATLFMMMNSSETVYLNEEKVNPKKFKSMHGEENLWYLDNGASNHMTGNKEFFSELNERVTGKVRFGDDSCVTIEGKGSILFTTKTGEHRILTEVYYIPSLRSNIISLGQLTETGCKVVMEDDVLLVYDKARTLMMKVFREINRMYKIKLVVGSPVCLLSKLDDVAWLWHARLGHLNFDSMRRIGSKNMVRGMPVVNHPSNICDCCLIGKQTQKPYPTKAMYRATRPLELLHGDLCGHITPSTPGGCRYMFLIVDDFSRYMWCFLLKSKDQAFETFKRFKAFIEKDLSLKIGTFRTDRGGEFTSTEFNDWCENNAIRRHLTAPYSPQQNGVVERRNQTVIGMVRCMLKQTKVPQRFWGEAAKHSVYVLNRSPTKAVDTKTPYEALLKKKPNLEFLRVFGCVGFATEPKVDQHKLDDRGRAMVYFGSEPGSKAFRMYDPVENKIRIRRTVRFDEKRGWEWKQNRSDPEFFTVVLHSDHDGHSSETTTESDLDLNTPEGASGTVNQQQNTAAFQQQIAVSGSSSASSAAAHSSPLSSAALDGSSASMEAGSGEPMPVFADHVEVETPLRRSTRQRRMPVKFKDFHVQDRVNREEPEELLLAAEDEPTSYSQAKGNKFWEKAMRVELESIEKNKTWTLTKLPGNIKPIGLKWVYKLKRDASGKIIKYKARLVAKGYVQQFGIDFDEVFAPVARMETVRLLLAHAAYKGWQVHHLDVKSAFLHGDLKEVVYVSQPEGFVKKGHEEKVYRLTKALYGLRQAPRAWNLKLDGTLKILGFKRCSKEQAIYTKHEGNELIIMGVYVDDLIVTSSCTKKIEEFKKQMEEKFEMSDLGLLSYYLGIEVKQTEKGITIKQEGYAKKILKETSLLECNPAKCPMDPGLKLSKDERGEPVDPTNYRRLVGCLRYLLNTRPDLSYAVGIASRYMQSPMVSHLVAVKQILRYVSGTTSYGLRYKRGGSHKIIGYSDSSHNTDTDDGKSTTGHIFYFGETPISWCSQKQNTVALSSCEAEFMAATSAACQAIWLRSLYGEIIGGEMQKILIWVDNKSAIALMKNPVFHGRSKHIDTRYHFIRECVENELVEIEYVSGDKQRADILTKALARVKFMEMRGLLGMEGLSLSRFGN